MPSGAGCCRGTGSLEMGGVHFIICKVNSFQARFIEKVSVRRDELSIDAISMYGNEYFCNS